MVGTAATPSFVANDVGPLLHDADRERTNKIKIVLVTSGAIVDDGDIMPVILKNYNLKKIWGVRGITHTVVNSVMVVEPPTTTVSAGVLSITVGGSTDNKIRSFMIIGEEN